MEDPATTCSKHDYAHLGLAAVFVSYSQPESGAFLLKTQAVENKISLQFFFSFLRTSFLGKEMETRIRTIPDPGQLSRALSMCCT